MAEKHLHVEFGTHSAVLSSCIMSQFNIVGKLWGKSKSKKVQAAGSQLVLAGDGSAHRSALSNARSGPLAAKRCLRRVA